MGGRVSQQQQSRAYTRPKGDPALTTYTGQVVLVGDPEIGKNGKERPRKIMISDNPGQYQGKTFRIWSWKEDDFSKLQVGQWVTVHYEVEPSLDPTRRGANAISVVETAEQGAGSGGGQPRTSVGEGNDAERSPAPEPSAAPLPESWGATKAAVARDEYQDKTLDIESGWAIKAVLHISPELAGNDDLILDKALQLIILKRRLASELSRG